MKSAEHGMTGRGWLAGLLLVALVTFPVSVHSAEKKSTKPAAARTGPLKSDAPLNIASDRMEVSQKDRTILFEGHVVIQQEDLTITGRRMVVFAAGGGKGNEAESSMMDQIDRIEIEGDVRISQREKVATSEKSVYYHREQKIVLIGNPMVSQGEDRVQGRLITLYLADGRSVVEGGELSPVQAVLHPRKD
ncbi:MAG: lipopolysaccharide transport periplasmic protein LptA [Syntrophobacteraceae bacterium]|nr:lipopolysaccharide transport periplasmic protein LptA [Syntrophobacteraceae bacterium]